MSISSPVPTTDPGGSIAGIERVPGRCGGSPVIAGTRVSVRNVVEHLRVCAGGLDELLEDYPHLRRDQVEAALVYYARYPDEIEQEIREHQEAWEQVTLVAAE